MSTGSIGCLAFCGALALACGSGRANRGGPGRDASRDAAAAGTRGNGGRGANTATDSGSSGGAGGFTDASTMGEVGAPGHDAAQDSSSGSADARLDASGTLSDGGQGHDGLDSSDGDAADGGDVSDGGATDGGAFTRGALAYQNIGNAVVPGDIVDIEWHPSGRFALLLGANGRIARFTPKATAVTDEFTISFTRGARIAAAPSGAYFLIAGDDGATPELWRATVGSDDTLTFAQETAALTGAVASVRAEPTGDRFAIATRLSFQNALYTWTEASGLSASKLYSAAVGVSDVAFMNSTQVLVSEGVNGAGSSTWDLAGDSVADNGNDGICGNLGTIAWRPAGSFGFVVGISGNGLCVYDGSWTATALPGTSSGARPSGVHWHPSGDRALVVGGATGAPLEATVFEYRGGSASSYDAAKWIDASIPDFDVEPYSANGNTILLGVRWRPATACDEGLIVGTDTGSAFDPDDGLVIRFYDSTDPDCP